jgi:hypothetical protein
MATVSCRTRFASGAGRSCRGPAGREISAGETSAGGAMKTGLCSATYVVSTRSISAAALPMVSVVCAAVISL